ncbi:type II CAAX endopeptidase family protein [Amycolatopsis sp. YIM 10]|uniref:type II CAAX endopeptidase family protein n=1 Tax=Amycolatopsis sp. YIM 10 TaxID=2653857 RepID=UPI0012904E0B|nr:type II CAAX endopeptidase family protein [Amycolatopsis sp. YIM 10]QFU88657.1 CAAX amino terminal protease self- immunity [Amycolatopsis sp. YIM 10]
MATKRTRPQSRPLVVFFALAFLIGWGALASLIAFGDLMEPVFGPPSGTHPVFVLAVYSPEFAALYVIWRKAGLRDVRDHLRRLTLWRMPAGWWWLLLLAMPAGKYLSALLNGTAGEFPFSPWHLVLLALIPALLLGPIEELGWRGYAQPMLQRRFNPLVTSLILGFFWGLWHLPAFLLSGTPQSAWSFGPFMLGAFALSIIMTPLFNVSGGSILVPALFHFQANLPVYPDGQPWENYVFALVAVVLVIWKRDHFLSRDGAVTDVVLRPRRPLAPGRGW